MKEMRITQKYQELRILIIKWRYINTKIELEDNSKHK